ncbi:LysR family transcriptional regulator [Actinokineospora guangxiensis]|uniref:LysR family transcriptional regulator n=1 Tax=Actinokineospora guangxiensis TaxID=1490288 RepID=A0ABW0EQL9_9PSEU
MDTRLLRTFCAVTRLGSFSAAARELGYTQSAVSQHIVALESDLGVPLLTRRPVGPTDAGARLLDHAVPLLLRLDAARADVARAAAEPAARLAVGVAPLAAAHLPAIARHARAAGVRELSVRVAAPGALPGALASGELDLAVVVSPAVRGDPPPLPALASLRSVPLAEAPALVAVPQGHPLTGEAALADLTEARWLAAPDAVGSLDDLCAGLGLPPLRTAVRCAGTDLDAPRLLAAAGEGLVLLPASALTPDLRGVPVRTPELVYRTDLLHPRSADRAVVAVVAALGAG